MKIYAVTSDFFSSVESLLNPLGKVDVLMPSSRPEDISADLIVFTGGEDIEPARYKESSKGSHGFNKQRDELELTVFRMILRGEIRTKKVLGICRGLQLLNVAMGGNLIQDIEQKFGVSHEYVHPLTHFKNNEFKFLDRTNSLHHQGINRPGNYGGKFVYNLLAIEPVTKVPEIVLWGNKFLGVQFHPEFFDDNNPHKNKFTDAMKKWIKGGRLICTEDAKNNLGVESHYNIYDTPYVTVSFDESRLFNNGFETGATVETTEE